MNEGIEFLGKGSPVPSKMRRNSAARSKISPGLQLSEGKYSYRMENAREGIGIVQQERAVYANRRLRACNGLSRDEACKTSLADIRHPEERDRLPERCRRRESGADVLPEGNTSRVRTSGNRTHRVEFGASRIGWKRKPAVLYFLHDIADPKGTERRMKVIKGLSDAFLTITDDQICKCILVIMIESLESPSGMKPVLSRELFQAFKPLIPLEERHG